MLRIDHARSHWVQGWATSRAHHVTAQVDSQIQAKQKQWLDRLAIDPARFAEVEQEIHDTFGKLADHTVAAILAEASQRPEMQTHKN